MEIFKEITPLKAFLKAKKQHHNTIGLVPTMGALHRGHLSLIETCQSQNNVTICSIFVNPAQFNNASDLEHYPRTLEQDTLLLEKVECDAIFCPESSEMYPGPPLVRFDFGPLDKIMEGEFRPGHFSGVALVVSKLFNIIEPDNAYFGQKDWQQFAIIRQLTEELRFNLKLHTVETTREDDGLAMSSRNQRLKGPDRLNAGVFYQALLAARESLIKGIALDKVRHTVREMVNARPGVSLEYFEVADSINLNQLDSVKASDRPILCIAGFVGEVRLIDNMFLY
ncbi:MAG TPA: pantoate--beta-alanine ligase [Ohtaekwangia sp.]|nr:pantoate--beta-alanine ligase [Ohtaekwangia sp.]